MSTTHHDLAQIGHRIAAAQDRALAGAAAPDADLLLAGVGVRRKRAARRRAIVAVATGALVVILGVLGALRLVPRADLAKSVVPPASQPALGTTRANDASVPLQFTDGTRVVVTHGATAELRDVQVHGATIALREGTLDVNVVHTDTSRWDIVAGAFDVRVTGTRFDATFDPVTARLTVAMKEGTVRVTGPCVDEPLAAPATKVFSCERASAPEIPTVSPDALPTAQAKTTSAKPAAPVAPHASARPSAPDDETTIEKGSASAVLALGDDARLGGDAARARKIYTRVRERFPRTEHAAKAAFLLGRMAESSGALDEAVRQYAIVTSESPGGAFGQDALGRTMEIEQRRGNTERAHGLAEQYLRAFPKGPHAAYATSVLDAHR